MKGTVSAWTIGTLDKNRFTWLFHFAHNVQLKLTYECTFHYMETISVQMQCPLFGCVYKL